MTSKFRQAKYLNESGSKKGSWYLNRLEYFEFHAYPGYHTHQLVALVTAVSALVLGAKLLSYSILLSVIAWYVLYVSLVTLKLLHRRICRYYGYFLYPGRIVRFFREREVEVDLDDFDSVATLKKH